ncbi:putative site-specific integrase [Paenibacillus sp. 598K]|uniref:site-specific integrase n=1 Tax=Paenibacillus sp. 598K TaxID=1117987 RepID=UPI000FFA218D|nr:site-specific integrase [Paenibacillus sp. 598K]GBF77254.1 putative site-specific integrase [Paenibacillus sp. 598K]
MKRVILLAFSGLRFGELCALKWSDLDFQKNENRTSKQIYSPKDNMREYELIPPKIPAGVRTFDIEPSVMEMLKSLQLYQSKVRLAVRLLIDDYHDKNFVFCRQNGYPFLQKNILIRVERILRLTSITKEATPHIFRHTHISMLAEAGVDLPVIMKRVGHDDMKTTLKIYTHVTEKMKKDSSEKVTFQFKHLLNV